MSTKKKWRRFHWHRLPQNLVEVAVKMPKMSEVEWSAFTNWGVVLEMVYDRDALAEVRSVMEQLFPKKIAKICNTKYRVTWSKYPNGRPK